MAQHAVAADNGEAAAQDRALRPIDLVHLAKQCLGDENLEQEVLRLFDTTILTYFGRLELASSHDDLAVNLHAIRGAASGVGAWTIADLAKSAELELEANRPLAPERIADIGIAVEEVRGAIARILGEDLD